MGENTFSLSVISFVNAKRDSDDDDDVGIELRRNELNLTERRRYIK